MVFVPLDLLEGRLQAIKMELTVVPKNYGDASPIPIFLYDMSVEGYIGVPVDWGLTKFSHLQFEDRTSKGNGLLLNASKKVNPHHKNAPAGQAEFIDKMIGVCSTNFTCFAVADTGCHAPGTKVMLSDGRFKSVEDIVVGDELMSPTSVPRSVLKLYRGVGQMYKITPKNGNSFIVNEDHILRLYYTPRYKNVPVEYKELSVKEYLSTHPTFKHRAKLYKSLVDFKELEVSLDPYVLGLLIGDGSLHRQVGFTNSNLGLAKYVIDCAELLGDTTRQEQGRNTCTYYFKGCNLKGKLIELNLYGTKAGDKFIPNRYKYNSREVRLKILAGLLDTDGYIGSNCFEFSTKSSTLCADIIYIARSLGFQVASRQIEVKGVTYYKVHISGDTHLIPTKFKVATLRKQIKNPLVTGFSIEPLGLGEYYGFNVEGNLYLLDDFTVTHNSGKTVSTLAVAAHYNMRTLVVVPDKRLARQWRDEVVDKLGIPKSRIALISGKDSEDHKASICIGIVNSVVQCDFSKKFYDSFGTVILDEAHRYGSQNFSKAVSLFNSTITIGMTATDGRGDMAEMCYRATLGPPRAISKAKSLPLDVHKIYYTGKPLYGDNAQMQISQLANDQQRNRMLADLIVRLYNSDRQILVASDRIEHLEELMTRCINLGVPEDMCGLYTRQKTVNGKRVAVKDSYLDTISKEAKIIFGIYKMCQTGIDIPRLDTAVEATPRATGTQFAGRVRRLLEDKKKPALFTVIDKHSGIFHGYFRKRNKDYLSIDANIQEGLPEWISTS